MSIGVALVAPLAAALLCITFEDARFSRWSAALMMIAAAAGAGVAAALSATGHEVAWRGFVADPWKAFLAAGALLCAAVAAVQGAHWRRAAISVHAGLVAASLLSPNMLWFGLALAGGTAAFAVAAVLGDARPGAIRSLGWLALTDVAAITALVASGSSLGRSMPVVDGWAAWVLLVAAAVKLGLVRTGDPLAIDGLGAAWMGPVRAQGALLAAIALRAGGGRGLALAGAGAAVAALRALAPLDEDKVIASAGAAVIAVGLGLGGPAATTGAVLVLAASFAGWAVRLGGTGAWFGTRALSAAPGGAAFAGTMLVAGAAAQSAAVKPGYLAIAIPVAAIAVRWLANVAPERTPRDRTGAAVAWIVPAFATLSLLVAVPALSVRRFGLLATSSLGVGRFLGPDQFAVTDELGIVIAALVLLGFLVPQPPIPRIEGRLVVPVMEDRITRTGVAVAWTLVASAAALAVALFFVARQRGFL